MDAFARRRNAARPSKLFGRGRPWRLGRGLRRGAVGHKPPAHSLACQEGHDLADPLGHRDRHLLKHDPRLVQRQAVETRAMLRREALETGERAVLLEHLRIGLQREGA